jgi:hypothetical protein
MNASLSKSHVCGSDNAAWLPLFSHRFGAGRWIQHPRVTSSYGKILPARSLANRATKPERSGWLGRRSITSTAVYTAFKDFWRDWRRKLTGLTRFPTAFYHSRDANELALCTMAESIEYRG